MRGSMGCNTLVGPAFVVAVLGLPAKRPSSLKKKKKEEKKRQSGHQMRTAAAGRDTATAPPPRSQGGGADASQIAIVSGGGSSANASRSIRVELDGVGGSNQAAVALVCTDDAGAEGFEIDRRAGDGVAERTGSLGGGECVRLFACDELVIYFLNYSRQFC
uniref:Uncharacterized protein n=1 Tax=Leersia perrieri TaxID=77586 RepID=A0A0D9WM98_9ORYZ